MKKILYTIGLLALLLPSVSYADFAAGFSATTSTSTTIYPTYINGSPRNILANSFVATSTATSTLPNLFTNVLSLGASAISYIHSLIDSYLGSPTAPIVYSGGVISCPTCALKTGGYTNTYNIAGTAITVSSATGSSTISVSTSTLATDGIVSNTYASSTFATIGSVSNYFTNSSATTSLSTGSILTALTGTFGTINATSTTGISTFNNSIVASGTVLTNSAVFGSTTAAANDGGSAIATVVEASTTADPATQGLVVTNPGLNPSNPNNGIELLMRGSEGYLAMTNGGEDLGIGNPSYGSNLNLDLTNVSTVSGFPYLLEMNTNKDGYWCPGASTNGGSNGTTCSVIYSSSGNGNITLAANELTDNTHAFVATGRGIAFDSYTNEVDYSNSGNRGFNYKFDTSTTSSSLGGMDYMDWDVDATKIMTLSNLGKLNVGSSSPATSTNAMISVNGSGTNNVFQALSSTSVPILTVTSNNQVNIPGLSSTVLAVDASGNIIATTTGGGGGTNYFTNSSATTSLNTGTILTAPTGTFGLLQATSTTGTSTLNNINVSNIAGAGLSLCSDTQTIIWVNGTFSCTAINVSGTGGTSHNGEVLTTTGGLAGWGQVDLSNSTWAVENNLGVGNGGTGSSSYAVGSILTGSSTNPVFATLIGASSTCLLSNGTIPVWGTCASGGGGSGNSAWTIGSGKIYNATTSDAVGIGSTSPGATLSVQGSTTNPTRPELSVASSSGAVSLYVDSKGNVDIGTTTSTFNLNVSGNTLFQYPNATDKGSGFEYNANGLSGWGFYTQSFQPLSLGTDAKEQLVIATTGNVGIGTSTPTQALTVYGGVLISSSTATTTDMNNAFTLGSTTAPQAFCVSVSGIPYFYSSTDSFYHYPVFTGGTAAPTSWATSTTCTN